MKRRDEDDDFIEIELMPGSGRYVRIPRRKSLLSRVIARRRSRRK